MGSDRGRSASRPNEPPPLPTPPVPGVGFSHPEEGGVEGGQRRAWPPDVSPSWSTSSVLAISEGRWQCGEGGPNDNSPSKCPTLPSAPHPPLSSWLLGMR